MSNTLSDAMIGTLVDGRYEIAARIARGGMATVYRAYDRRLERDVALKVMHPHLAESTDFVARFRREARAAARLNHTGIVGLYDQGASGDTSYLTMELVAGENLRSRLHHEQTFSLGESLRITAEVLSALGCAHRAGLVHRDMKPENVLLAEDGEVKVTDFGLARAVTEASAATTGTVLGTVAYLAPEIVSTGNADTRSDVYAVGIMLYEMLTGRQPFTGEVPIHIAFQHINEGVGPPSDLGPHLPVEIDELVAALTARAADERPADADEALELLQRARQLLASETLSDRTRLAATPHGQEATSQRTEPHRVGGTVALPIGAVSESVEPRPGKANPRRWPRVLGLLLAVVLIGAGGALWWFQAGPGAYTQVPEVMGMEEDAAVTLLTDAGLGPNVVREHHDTTPEGKVYAAEPGPGDDVRRDGEVKLHVSQGILMVEIPEVVGMQQEEAEEALATGGVEIGEVAEPWDEDVAEGVVIAAEPQPGETIPHNEPVDLTVSAGRKPVELVSVVGAEQDRAAQELQEAELTPSFSEEHDESVPEGEVISQSPSPDEDTQLYRGDTVEIVVSLGPEPIEVPDVVGLQIDEARTELEDAGFQVETDEVLGGFFETVRQMSPDPGEEALPDSVVTLTVV